MFKLKLLLVIGICLGLTNPHKKMSYSKDDILRELNNAGKDNPMVFFPDFNHPYSYPVISRMHLFADTYNWAIVFEICGYNNRTNSLNTQLVYFGSCLKNLDKVGDNISNTKFIDVVSEIQLMEVVDSNLVINNEVKNIEIKGKRIDIQRSLERYSQLGIKLEEDKIDIVSFFRYLGETSPNSLFLEESVVTQCLSYHIPKILHIDKWYHKSFGYVNGQLYGELPSSYETFNQIAEVLISKDKSKYKPSNKPNNHWSNWPNAGQL